MMVEEVKKAKELVTMQPKVKGGDDEPDWQNVRKQKRQFHQYFTSSFLTIFF
jgi:hypothetical protein